MLDAQRRADAEAQAREDFENDIKEAQRLRDKAVKKREALSKKKEDAEARAIEEARKRQEAKDKIEKKKEKRRQKKIQERQKVELEKREAEERARAIAEEVAMKLNDLKAQRDSMPKEDYILARISIKSAAVDFDKIGESGDREDDLQQIDGIDDRLELRLNTLGISTIEQLSKMDEVDADEINDAIENMPGRARRQLWAEQAQLLFEGN